MPAEQSNERVKSWTLPVCTGCGGILGFNGTGCCPCIPSWGKTGKLVTVIPADSRRVLSVEEARLLVQVFQGDADAGTVLVGRGFYKRLKDLAEGG